MISIIVATANNGVIGKSGALPWYLPADLLHFKETTMGRPIIMGRTTHESIKKALPGRTNIVISRNKSYKAEGCEVVSSLTEAIENAGDGEVFIIGGASVYEQALSLADRIYLTNVHADIDGDKFFKYDSSDWRQVSAKVHLTDDKNQYDYDFLVLERKK